MSQKSQKRKTTSAAKAAHPAARGKTAAKKVTKKAAPQKSAKSAATKRSGSARSSNQASTAARKAPAAKSARAKTAERPAPKKSSKKRSTAAPKKAAAPREQGGRAEAARRHFREILEAKQQRMKQGPSYPAPNAFTGRPHDGVSAVKQPSSAPVQDSSPGVEATYGEGEFASGRGNQGMRGQT